jgi:uncharacterized protein YeeX (DUF496 family)
MNDKEKKLIEELRRSPLLKQFLEYIHEKEAALDVWKYVSEDNLKRIQGKAQLIDEIKRDLANGR